MTCGHRSSEISCSSTRTRMFYAEIGGLKNLQVLDAMSNQLRTIPPELASCSSLKRLLLDRNLLAWLPRQLSTMNSLEEISAASNRLLYLPMGEKLRTLHVLLCVNRNKDRKISSFVFI